MTFSEARGFGTRAAAERDPPALPTTPGSSEEELWRGYSSHHLFSPKSSTTSRGRILAGMASG